MQRNRPHRLTPEAAAALEATPIETLDPDALYALDVLHQALQALRRHCERTGKPHLWIFFEEIYLAQEFRGRQAKTRAELLAAYPGKDMGFVDDSLTTAKRAFKRLVREVVPRGLRDDLGAEDCFREWMEILRNSHASQYDLLHVAYWVTPYVDPGMTAVPSAALRVDDLSQTPGAKAASKPSDDELAILISFRLELPLVEMVEVTELKSCIPPSNPFWRNPRSAPTGTSDPAPARPLCLLTLIEPSPAEAVALAAADIVSLLKQIKDLAKQLHHLQDHSMPPLFSRLLYTLVIVLGFVRYNVRLHSIDDEQLSRSIRWFLKHSWLDSRLRPLFEQGAAALGSSVPGHK